ncbi:hypothetical protein Q8A67_000001 [Cirrhinus molitorella]|uniref:Uncharacterized protein n=1 Tax=Cirrhinus molitorella TaxID=172907 RepID=A0AA88T821_9TELE|nr:hypothetical protein Q8A67_000001 [Cirrhinus molitorella]
MTSRPPTNFTSPTSPTHQAVEHRRLFEAALEGKERGPPSTADVPVKRRSPKAGTSKVSGSPCVGLQRLGRRGRVPRVWDVQSRVHRGKSASRNRIESALGQRDDRLLTRARSAVAVTPMKRPKTSVQAVSPLKIQQGPSSVTLLGMQKRKKATEAVKKAMQRRRQCK